VYIEVPKNGNGNDCFKGFKNCLSVRRSIFPNSDKPLA
jgi:hypothetical protein